MEKWLDIGAALFAIAAAIFWFVSASELPPLVTYWGQTPPSDPYVMAMKFSAVMNRWAALLTGLSALCMGVKHFLR
jgi:hypothetical protein